VGTGPSSSSGFSYHDKELLILLPPTLLSSSGIWLIPEIPDVLLRLASSYNILLPCPDLKLMQQPGQHIMPGAYMPIQLLSQPLNVVGPVAIMESTYSDVSPMVIPISYSQTPGRKCGVSGDAPNLWWIEGKRVKVVVLWYVNQSVSALLCTIYVPN
jgi:hypothetical protein